MITVLVPAPTQDLTTLEAVKAELDVTGTADDAVISSLIRQASGQIGRYCHRVFGQETVREKFTSTYRRGAAPRELFLSRTPVVSISSVTHDGTLADPSDYSFDAESGKLLAGDGMCAYGWGGSSVAVEYVGGYALLAGLPHELERACTDLVKRHYYARSRDPALRSEQVLDVVNASWTSADTMPTKRGLPVDIAESIDDFVRYTV